MITELGMTKASKAIYEIVSGIRCVFDDGSHKDLPLYDSSEHTADHVKLMGLLADDVVGRITKLVLLDNAGEAFAEREVSLEKDEAEGLLVSFLIRIYESEVK